MFVGLDLAWSSRYESGLCVLALGSGGLELVSIEAARRDPNWFADFVADLGPEVIVAIDAPLIVGGARMAERELGRVFGRYKAGAYLATPTFLAKSGTAGPELAGALLERGFSLDPARIADGTGCAIEVYPHAAHVVLFGLNERIPYKKGRIDVRRAGMGAYQEHLARLLTAHPGVAEEAAVEALLDRSAIAVTGRALKHLEDSLDALTCAYVAYHAWKQGPAGVRVFGDAASGYILVPWSDAFA